MTVSPSPYRKKDHEGTIIRALMDITPSPHMVTAPDVAKLLVIPVLKGLILKFPLHDQFSI